MRGGFKKESHEKVQSITNYDSRQTFKEGMADASLKAKSPELGPGRCPMRSMLKKEVNRAAQTGEKGLVVQTKLVVTSVKKWGGRCETSNGKKGGPT